MSAIELTHDPGDSPHAIDAHRRTDTGRITFWLFAAAVGILAIWPLFEVFQALDRWRTENLLMDCGASVSSADRLEYDCPDLPMLQLLYRLTGVPRLYSPEELEISGAPVESDLLARIARLRTVTTLELRNTIADPADIRYIGLCERLESLSLYEDHFTDDSLASLHRLENLQRLVLQGAKITDAGMASLARIKVRDSLTIYGAGITDDGLMELATMTGLRTLGLGKTATTPQGWARLRQALPNLRIESVGSPLWICEENSAASPEGESPSAGETATHPPIDEE